MDVFFPLAAFALTLVAGYYYSLGTALCMVFLFGYLNGIIRANFPGIWTTFQFDSAVLGLYLFFLLTRTSRQWMAIWSTPFGWCLIAVIVWPLLMCLVPVNAPLIQVAAARSIVWYLTVAVIAFHLRPKDLRTLAAGLALLNLMALGFAVYIYFRGIESLFPKNEVTFHLYKMQDVGGGITDFPPASSTPSTTAPR